MHICLPVEQAEGLDSKIFPNLRAAPALLIVNSGNGEIEAIHTSAGVCGAIPDDIDILVFAGGIGRGMFNGLQRKGVRVFATDCDTVRNALAQLAEGTLQEVGDVPDCAGGQHAHQAQGEAAASGCGCGHHHEEEKTAHAQHRCGCGH